MPYNTLRFEMRGAVAHITLDRPDTLNALSAQMADDLAGAVAECGQQGARAVILTGAGKAFCAGGDLHGFAAAGRDAGSEIKRVLGRLHAAVIGLATMDAPVIAAVNGVAAGAGLSLACACDLVLAAESARFTVAYTRAGLTPDASGTYFLPRRVGLGRALELAITNRILSAHEALDYGLATRVVPDADLMGEAETLARQLAEGPSGAFGGAKRLIHLGWGATLEEQLAREAESIIQRAGSDDGQEGIHAFVEKRPPHFTGR